MLAPRGIPYLNYKYGDPTAPWILYSFAEVMEPDTSPMPPLHHAVSRPPRARSDTIYVSPELPWSNPRPSTGPTPVPPRNEPLLYIPSADDEPMLLKLLYLSNAMVPRSLLPATLDGMIPQSS
jgi:hypothetical protein